MTKTLTVTKVKSVYFNVTCPLNTIVLGKTINAKMHNKNP